jgi:hypothetical protein
MGAVIPYLLIHMSPLPTPKQTLIASIAHFISIGKRDVQWVGSQFFLAYLPALCYTFVLAGDSSRICVIIVITY